MDEANRLWVLLPGHPGPVRMSEKSTRIMPQVDLLQDHHKQCIYFFWEEEGATQ
jgi:hypothetical protein